MTAPQEEAVARCKEILNEHFEGWLLVLQAEVDDTKDHYPAFWNGGYATALGLAHIAAMDLSRQPGNREENEP